MPFKTILAAAALAVLPVAAQAADIAGDGSTTASLPVSGSQTTGYFEKTGDTDWYRVSLKAGKDYAIDGGGTYAARITLRGTTGKEIQHTIADGSSPGGRDGFEFHAAVSGTYFVAVHDESGGAADYPSQYVVRVSTDCRGSSSTTCVQKIGTTSRWLENWPTDLDAIKIPLVAGKNYTVTTPQDAFYFRLLDPSGKIVAQQKDAYADPVLLTYKAARTGTYLLKIVSADDDPAGWYDLSVTSP